MRKAEVYFQGVLAGVLTELKKGEQYRFEYDPTYNGSPVALTMPYPPLIYTFSAFPSFFDGLLPEG